MSTEESTASLQQKLDALTARVNALEESQAAQEPTAPHHVPVDADEIFWSLNGLKSRLDENSDGAVMLTGALALPDGPVDWQEGGDTATMLDTDWSEQAASFSALGHPVRLELLRHILAGMHSTAELAELETLGTTGQLHHHLRQLVAAGWVRARGRGSYEVPAARVVPLLACMIGAGL